MLNVLLGLNEQYSHMIALLKPSRPFPSFDEVRNDLLLEELTVRKVRPFSTPSTVLITTTPKGTTPSLPPPSLPPSVVPPAALASPGTAARTGTRAVCLLAFLL